MKNKIKTSAFWISLTSVVVVCINLLGKVLNFNVDLMSIISIASCVIGMLITVGVLSREKTSNDASITKQVQDEIIEKIQDMDKTTSFADSQELSNKDLNKNEENTKNKM